MGSINGRLRAHLIDCNGNCIGIGIGIGIGITSNTRCYNVILITIHLLDKNTIIES